MKKKGTISIKELQLGAMKALRIAVKKALARHAAAGVPAAIWQDGKVVYLPVRRSKKRRRKMH